jgi:tetratricopeptide (TPR) repeat protein
VRASTVVLVLISLAAGYLMSVPLFGRVDKLSLNVRDLLSQADADACLRSGGRIEWSQTLFRQRCSTKTYASPEYDWFRLPNLTLVREQMRAQCKEPGLYAPRPPIPSDVCKDLEQSNSVPLRDAGEILAGAAIFALIVLAPVLALSGSPWFAAAVAAAATLGGFGYAIWDTRTLACRDAPQLLVPYTAAGLPADDTDDFRIKACFELAKRGSEAFGDLRFDSLYDGLNRLLMGLHKVELIVAGKRFEGKPAEDAISLLDDATARFTEAINKDPKNELAYLERGLAAQATGVALQFGGGAGVHDFDQAIAINPKSAFAYTTRALAHKAKHETDAAISDLSQAISIDPTSAFAYLQRGVTYEMTGDHDKAIVDETKAIEIDPKYAKAYAVRAAAYKTKGDYDKASADETKASEINTMLAPD